MNRVIALALLATVVGSPATAVEVPPLPGSVMPIGKITRPVRAWEVFCAQSKYADECALDRHEPRTIALTARTWAQIVTANRVVNSSIHAHSDVAHWGQADVWDLAEDGSGDCEDFALRKRHLLARSGLPMRVMRMTVVSQDGTGHAVLTVATDRGDLVLDNQTTKVRFWKETNYAFIKRESQDEKGWVAIESPPTHVAPPAYAEEEQSYFRSTSVEQTSGFLSQP